MPVPTYDLFIEPILRYLEQHPDGAPAQEVYEAAACALGLTKDDRREVMRSGQSVYKNRAGWAQDRLKRRGYSSMPRRGHWQLTPQGIEFAQTHPSPFSGSLVAALSSDVATPEVPTETQRPGTGPKPAQASPDDRLAMAVKEIRESVAANLLEALFHVSPTRFEHIVLDVLHKIGYGTSRGDLQRLGGSGDSGVDGVISLDRLGLERVYVQAKRWQTNIGRPDIQGFYGALAGQRARKGVFITTSSYTPQAREFANSVEGVVLVDGRHLAEMMMDYGVGVQIQSVSVPSIDNDYFEE
jgi:restriction system protein